MRVAVVGGGIAGLSAALELADRRAEVVVFEAAERFGGKLATSVIGGVAVDEGPDAFLARRPEAIDLARRVGLGDTLVSPAVGWASVYWDGRRHRMPAGLVLGVPGGWAGLVGLARSPLVGPMGAARAALEPLVARRRSSASNDCLGTEIRTRFGSRVAERLVDPLLGGINAGDADRLSLAAASPQLAAAATGARSLLVGVGRSRSATPDTPVFLTPSAGLTSLVDGVVTTLGDRVDLRAGQAVQAIEPAAGAWSVAGERFDAVVVATPGWAAAPLLAPLAPAAADVVGAVPYSSVGIVTLVVSRTAFAAKAAIEGSGVLVPKPQQRHVTAVSFGSRKWAHWCVPDAEVLRVSVGRDGDEHALDHDDETLVRAVLADLVDIVGLEGDPDEVRVSRWPRSFPQYRPWHLERIAAAERALRAAAPGVVLAGAALRGVGIPACIASGRAAAAAVAEDRALAPA